MINLKVFVTRHRVWIANYRTHNSQLQVATGKHFAMKAYGAVDV
jgi:hypothetical protein